MRARTRINMPEGIETRGERTCRVIGVIADDEPDLAADAPFGVAVETETGPLRLEVTEEAARRLRELLDDYLALRDLPRLRKRR